MGDTLKTVSGGSHPGLFHVQKKGDNYTVTAFEQVEDGAGNEASARRIFGENYDEYIGDNGCDQHGLLEDIRYKTIKRYVKEHGLNVTMYKDYGWPAVPLNID